jgi:hypothetical protein
VDTHVRTPQEVFNQPQRLVVPLFQRPYVWTRDRQWEPLWNDVLRVAKRLMAKPLSKHQPHFLGAVVLQQSPNPIGMMQQRTIIDGQQRLTTLQLLLDALRIELSAIGANLPAKRLEDLTSNAEHFRNRPEDRFKVWPTNRDRSAFNHIMGGESLSVEQEATNYRISQAHAFFREKTREWLSENQEDSAQLESQQHAAKHFGETTADPAVSAPTAKAKEAEARAKSLETVVRELLQMVVIDLSAEENAQDIFETLNDRGSQLTAADLIKNFIFQRLKEADQAIDIIYEEHWKDFETGFWEMEISVGRFRYPRSSVFLNHWLTAQTGDEVVAREVFDRFKSFAKDEAGVDMAQLVAKIHSNAASYRDFVESTAQPGAGDRLSLFGYRTGVLESEVIKPLVLYLKDPHQPEVEKEQLHKALEVVESWMVRRMLVRASTKSYTQIIAEMIRHLMNGNRSVAGDALEAFLAAGSTAARYWPGDDEVRRELESLAAYKRLGRGRLRMVLEAIEDHLRGWRGDRRGLGDERVAKKKYPTEHVMPRKWQQHWPYEGDPAERDHIVHTLGNLTLLTKPLNSKASNGPWLGVEGKRAKLNEHDVFLLNRELVRDAGDEWNEVLIERRTRKLIEIIISIWPVPPGHKVELTLDRPKRHQKIGLRELIDAGELTPGMVLYPSRKSQLLRVATLLEDGKIDVEGVAYDGPSPAATALKGKRTNGWSFFVTEQESRRTLRQVRREYLSQLSEEDDDDDDDGD